jgi:hypothetical protein
MPINNSSSLFGVLGIMELPPLCLEIRWLARQFAQHVNVMKALYFLVGTRDLATSLVESTSKEYPDYSLVVTGHSLGAAQSGYAAAEFRTNGTNATLYNYGGPHLGDATFADFVTGQGGNYRVTHTNDPAPHIGDPSQGYRHINPEYWIYEDRNANYTVSTNQIMAIPGINSDVGNQVSTVIRFTSP